MVVVLDPNVWVAERAPRTLSGAVRRPGFWTLHVCVCDEGLRNMHPNSKLTQDVFVAHG